MIDFLFKYILVPSRASNFLFIFMNEPHFEKDVNIKDTYIIIIVV